MNGFKEYLKGYVGGVKSLLVYQDELQNRRKQRCRNEYPKGGKPDGVKRNTAECHAHNHGQENHLDNDVVRNHEIKACKTDRETRHQNHLERAVLPVMKTLVHGRLVEEVIRRFHASQRMHHIKSQPERHDPAPDIAPASQGKNKVQQHADRNDRCRPVL